MESDCDARLLFSEEQLRKIFNSLSAHIAIIDKHGFILETNAAWKNFSRNNGMPEDFDFRQLNYFNICEAAVGSDMKDAVTVASGIRNVIAKKTDEFLYDYPCHSPGGHPRWFYMRAVLIAENDPSRVIISHEDITQLKLTQEQLKKSQETLEDKNQSLEEANIALKVLLRHRETDKEALEKKFLTNVKTFVLPYLRKLKQAPLNEKNKTLVQIVEDHLNDIISPLMQTLSNAGVMLTPQEIQVAALIKDGKTTTEIADILFVSEATISFHRKNLRKKLGIQNRQANLRSFLLNMA